MPSKGLRAKRAKFVTGALLSSTVEGQESTYPGGSFSLTTTTQPNAAGQPLAIDPSGHGTADQTRFTYDPARGNLGGRTR